MDFLNRVANSPQVQQALFDFVPGLRSKVDQIFGIHRPDNSYTNYELNIISPEDTTGPMPVVATPSNYDYFRDQQQSKQFDFPPEYEDAVRAQAIRYLTSIPDRKYGLPKSYGP